MNALKRIMHGLNRNSDMRAAIFIAIKLADIRIISISHDEDDLTDDSVELGGEYEGIELQLGHGYYCINRQLNDDEWMSWEGQGDIIAELNRARDYVDD